MKMNGDEKRIQQLFRELSTDERQQAPEFFNVLAAARSGTAPSRSRGLTFRLTMVLAMVFAALLATAIIVRPSKPQDAATPEQAFAPTMQRADPDIIGTSRPDDEVASGSGLRRFIPKRVRHRRRSDQIAIAMKSLFAWQSPTIALMTTHDDQLLNSLPRLGESLQTIKTYSPDQFN